VWYQPFCPSMLLSDAADLLENFDGRTSPYMTCAYRVRKEKAHLVRGVINVDYSCRPQIVADEQDTAYAQLLREVKKTSGCGVVLNTSLNLHGEPLVCSPEDARRTFEQSGFEYLFLEDYLVRKI
jgi:carbamoyltransferase